MRNFFWTIIKFVACDEILLQNWVVSAPSNTNGTSSSKILFLPPFMRWGGSNNGTISSRSSSIVNPLIDFLVHLTFCSSVSTVIVDALLAPTSHPVKNSWVLRSWEDVSKNEAFPSTVHPLTLFPRGDNTTVGSKEFKYLAPCILSCRNLQIQIP